MSQKMRASSKPVRPRARTARRLRRDATDVEQRLWLALRDASFRHRVRRQHPIGRHVVDFAIPVLKLAIELDGGQHEMEHEADARRSEEIGKHGYRVIRFWNSDVMENLDSVLQAIDQEIRQLEERREKPTSPRPSPP